MKKGFIILLAVAVLFASFGFSSVQANSVSENVFKDGSNQTAVMVQPGDTYGLQFSALVPFSAITVNCPSWANNIGSLTFSLHSWQDDYVKTIENTPSAQKRFTNYEDNAELTISFSSMPAGVYVLTLSMATSDPVGFWAFQDDAADGTRVIQNNAVLSVGMNASITFDEEADAYFGVLPDFTIAGSSVAPPEYVYPDDSPVVTVNAQPSSWVAVDGLGRTLSTANEVGTEKKDHFVGCFYWTWHYSFAPSYQARNINNIIKQYPEAQNNYGHSVWSSEGLFQNFWDEPLYGYYSTLDEWVIRRQAEMLANAGVDVIIFDATNAQFTWKGGYETVFKVFREAREDGIKTPQIAFMFNFGSSGDANTKAELRQVYQDIYYPGRYQDLWFYWKGKPLVLARQQAVSGSNSLDSEISQYFTFKTNEASYFAGDTDRSDNTWGWCSSYPQDQYGVDENGKAEEMTVSVAQNAYYGTLTAMNDPRGAQGRSYTNGEYSYSYTKNGQRVSVDKSTENSMYYGLNFQQQWDYALQKDPEFIFITGWNEWIAGRYPSWMGVSNAFPDEFNDEYSRDVEPSKGELKDYYYYQMVENIRRYKGCTAQQPLSAQNTIDVFGAVSQWDHAGVSYSNYNADDQARNADGFVGYHYDTANTVRNEITLSKVAYDQDNVYFMAQTKDNLTSSQDPGWMRLLIDTDFSGTSANWEGFEYIVNRTSPEGNTAVLEKSKGGWDYETVGKVDFSVQNNVLQIAVPRSMLGLTDGDALPDFSYKWSDNMQADGDVLDFYTSGTVAPSGRFAYLVTTRQYEALPAYGDINEDGKINTTDALLTLRAAVNKITFTERQIKIGDVDGNSKINTTDALLILRKAVNKIEKFPVEQNTAEWR